jgi:hypothetical protein
MLRFEDLIPLEEYETRREEFFQQFLHYVDSDRRIRLGTACTLIFENRRTLWFRLQELLRLTQLTDPKLIQAQIDWYNRLLPTADRLQASLLLPLTNPIRSTIPQMVIHFASTPISGEMVSHSGSGSSTAHWLEFSIPSANLFLDQPIEIEAIFAEEKSIRVELSTSLRESLQEDLISSIPEAILIQDDSLFVH